MQGRKWTDERIMEALKSFGLRATWERGYVDVGNMHSASSMGRTGKVAVDPIELIRLLNKLIEDD